MKQDVRCSHGCKEFCTALEIATLREKEAILQYDALRDECDYPDVKAMLNELIIQRQKSIRLLDEVKILMKSKFEVLDQIQEGYKA
jgi:rubrerythrin